MAQGVQTEGEGAVRIKKRVLVADAYRLWRQILKQIIEGFGRYQIVGEASDGRTLLAQAEQTRPDLVLLDIALPHFEEVRRSVSALSSSRLLILSEVEEPEIVRDAFAAGALGYVSKYEDEAVLRRALTTVCRGFSFLSPRIARRILDRVPSGEAEVPADQTSGSSQIASKALPLIERDILTLLSRGYSDRAIASRLAVSREVINYYRLDILRRLPPRTGTIST